MPFSELRPKQPDPYIVKAWHQELAKFGHLSVLVGYINTLEGQIGGAGAKMNMTAGAPPTGNDDSTQGYSVNSGWFDIANGIVYWLQDATPGAAVWEPEPSGGSGSAIIVTTEADAQTDITNSALVPNAIYNIVDADTTFRSNLLVRAKSVNEFYTGAEGIFQNGAMSNGPVICTMEYVLTASTGRIHSVREPIRNNYVSCETNFTPLDFFRFELPNWRDNTWIGGTMSEPGDNGEVINTNLTFCDVLFNNFLNCAVNNVIAVDKTLIFGADGESYFNVSYIGEERVTTLVEVPTWGDLTTLAGGGGLIPGNMYHVVDAIEGTANITECWVQAASPTSLAAEGRGLMTNAHTTDQPGIIGFQGLGVSIGIKYWKSGAYVINKAGSFNTWFNAWMGILYRANVNYLDVYGDVPSISLAGNINGYFGLGLGLDVPFGTSLAIGVKSESASITLTGTQNISLSTFVNCDLDITSGIISNSYTTNGESVVHDPIFGRMSSMIVTSADTGGLTNPDFSGLIDLTGIEHVGTIIIDGAGANLITIASFSFLPLLLAPSGITLTIDDYTITGGLGNIKLIAPATSINVLSGQTIRLAYGGGFWQQQAPVLAYN